jgi:dihydrofolate reductase
MATVDVLTIGRKTYETALAFEAWPYGDRAVFVLSGSPLAPPPPGVRVERLSGEPREIVAGLDARGFRHAYVDGGSTIQGFLRAGMIGRLVITRVPVLLGEGIALFGSTGRDIPLRHVATRTLAGGLVQSEYAID